MNEYVMYKSQTSFEKALEVLRHSKLSAKTKNQIENFARMRLASSCLLESRKKVVIAT